MGEPTVETDFQLFPPLSEQEFAELKADIAERGVMVPVEYDEHGNTLDGHHRERACRELGITEFPSVVRKGMTDAEKRHHVRKLNLARRHLTREQRNRVMQDMRDDGMSTRQIADAVGVSQMTVVNNTDVGEQNYSPDDKPKVNGRDGKSYPATKPKPAAKVDATVDEPEPEPDDEAEVEGETHTPPASERYSKASLAAEFRPARQAIIDAKVAVDALARTRAGRALGIQRQWMNRLFGEIRGRLSAAVPTEKCEQCNGRGCILCDATGYVPAPLVSRSRRGQHVKLRTGSRDGVEIAHDAINCLKTLPPDDELRERAFQIVADYIEANR